MFIQLLKYCVEIKLILHINSTKKYLLNIVHTFS